ncbi:MAG TPA: hypothetical protein VFH68_24620 [Polyangia bacterium]|jgi:hypothetical protein|nr:hypothetical protein [Polyangia bacterium]
MKFTIGIAIFATLGLAAGMSGQALAQAEPAAGGGGIAKPGSSGDDSNTTYKAKTVYDFEDDMVEGDLQRPDGELVNSLGKTQHSSLIEIRKDFIPEMLKSLEDV